MTTRPGYRWLLPAGHLVIDCLVLALWVWHAEMVDRERPTFHAAAVVRPVLLQEGGGPVFHDVYRHPPQEFGFMVLGTLPVGIVSIAIRPQAVSQSARQGWDPIWFLVHQGLSFPWWLLIGVLVDTGRWPLKKLMTSYLIARVSFATLILVPGIARLGTLAELLFWFGLGSWAAVAAIRAVLRINPRRPSFETPPD
jgi:hypothetical protein